LALALIAGTVAGCSDGQGDTDEVDFIQRARSRLIKVQTVGLAAFGPINPHSAIPSHATAAFGEPASTRLRGGRCLRRWPDLGLTIEFAVPGGEDACGESARIQRIRLAGPAAAEAGWRTAEGIRPGMPLAAARRIYPEARRAGKRLILVRGPAGDSGERVTVLKARSAAGEVTGMTLPIRK
jgi:hypothetical protein